MKNGAPLKTAMRFYSIPPSMLDDHLSQRSQSTKYGPPLVLRDEEESALEKYMIDIAEFGHPLSMDKLRLKVGLLTQERVTPFTDGIPGPLWLRWFKKRHPSLILRQSQGLEVARAKGLSVENVNTFYRNLEELYGRLSLPT